MCLTGCVLHVITDAGAGPPDAADRPSLPGGQGGAGDARHAGVDRDAVRRPSAESARVTTHVAQRDAARHLQVGGDGRGDN